MSYCTLEEAWGSNFQNTNGTNNTNNANNANNANNSNNYSNSTSNKSSNLNSNSKSYPVVSKKLSVPTDNLYNNDLKDGATFNGKYYGGKASTRNISNKKSLLVCFDLEISLL